MWTVTVAMSPIESISQISLKSSSLVKTWLGFSARNVRRSNSFVVKGFSSPLTNTLLAVLSILIPLISIILLLFLELLTSLSYLARYDRLVSNSKNNNNIIEIRGIKIDKTARRVFVNGEEKPFTTKEFDLLTFLAENPNHVFTKEELFKEIWDMDSIGDIATVTVHIKKIREKIELDTSKPQYIETIWGVGYRFKM